MEKQCGHCGNADAKFKCACKLVRYCSQACQRGAWSVHKADCNNRRKEQEFIFRACLEGDQERGRLLIPSFSNVNFKYTYNGRITTPLHISSHMGHVELVRLCIANLTRAGSLATVNDAHGDYTPIFIASQLGHLEVVVELLAVAFIDVDRPSKNHSTALHVAAQLGFVPIVRVLIAAGATIDPGPADISTPLITAAQAGAAERATGKPFSPVADYVAIVRLLIESGSDVNRTFLHSPGNRIHALAMACINDNCDVVRELLKAKSLLVDKEFSFNPDGPSSTESCDMITPLLFAVESRNLLLTQILCTRADVNYKRARDGCTALHIAVYTEQEALVKVLIEEGKANVNALMNTLASPLHVACDTKNVKIVEMLLAHAADVTLVTVNGMTMLDAADRCAKCTALVQARFYRSQEIIKAVSAGDVDFVKELLAEGICVDFRCEEHQFFTALLSAVCLENLELVRVLVAAGARADLAGKGYCPIHMACEAGKLSLMTALQPAQGFNIEQEITGDGDTAGCTPLRVAIDCGSIDIINWLLDNGVEHDVLDKTGVTYLISSIQILSNTGDPEQNNVIKALLRKVDPNQFDTDGTTALHWASKNLLLPVLRELVNAGGDVNIVAKTASGTTPLIMISCVPEDTMSITDKAKQKEGIDFLVSRGAKLDLNDGGGASPLSVAASQGSLNALEALIKLGGDVNSTDFRGFTALHACCCKGGNVLKIRALLRAGADVNKLTNGVEFVKGEKIRSDEMIMTALTVAARNGNAAAVRLLAKEGNADVNKRRGDNCTSLIIACQHGHISVVKELLSFSADVNFLNNDVVIHAKCECCMHNGTALMAASANGHLDVVRVLLDAGADPRAFLADGRTALEVAIAHGHKSICVLLQRKLEELDVSR